MQSAAPIHRWGVAAYVADDRCDQRLTCERCHTSIATGVAHDWGEWTLIETGDRSARTCRHCGEIMRRAAESPAVPSSASSAPRPSALAVNSPAPKGSLSSAEMHGTRGDFRATVDGSQEEVIAMTGRFEAHNELDSDLLGHWRGTDFLSSGGMSLVTDLHLVFADDGNFVFARQSSGPAGTSPLEMAGEGTWLTSAGALELRWVDRGSSNHQYYVEDGSLLLPDERNWPRIWHAS